jgi:copper transport protein
MRTKRTGRAPSAARSLRRSAALLLGAAAAVLLLAQPASAHANLVRSDPPNGGVLARAPAVARLWYSEEISPEFSSARVVDRTGAAITGSRAQVGGDPRQLTVELPSLRKGTYGLVWRVLAEDDGHATSGVVVFTVGGAAAAAGAIPAAAGATPAAAGAGVEGTAATPVGVLLRWLGLCALAGLVGCLAVAGPVLGRARAAAAPDTVAAGARLARRRLLAVAAGCAAAAVAGGVLTLAEEGRRAAGGGRALGQAVLDLLTGTRWGHLWLAREAALIALVTVLLGIRSRLGEARARRATVLSVTAAALVLAVAWVEALGSHSAALESARGAAVAAYSLHVLTGLLWLGALPALVLTLFPRVAGLPPRDVARACRGPFSTLIVISVTVLVVTGLYGAGRQVPEPGQLLSTTYGRTLLLKTALLAAVGGLGLANSALLHGRRPGKRGRLVRAPGGAAPSRRLIIAEALAGAVVLAAAGLLAETAPPRAPVSAVPLAEPRAYDTTVGDLVVSVSATPNRPGANGFTVLAESSRRPPPAPIERVTLGLGRSGERGTLPLRQIEPGRYFGTGRLDSAGPITITAVIRRAGERLTVTMPWRVSPKAAPPTAARQEHRLAPYLNAVALCVLVLALSAGVARVVARRGRDRKLGTESPARAEILEDVR